MIDCVIAPVHHYRCLKHLPSTVLFISGFPSPVSLLQGKTVEIETSIARLRQPRVSTFPARGLVVFDAERVSCIIRQRENRRLE